MLDSFDSVCYSTVTIEKGKRNGLVNYCSVIVKFYRLWWNCSVSNNHPQRYLQNPGREKVMDNITEIMLTTITLCFFVALFVVVLV